MNCHRPYIHEGGAAGCGQCLPCRINKRRVWTHRIILETALREDNAFVTLTYDDDNLPKNEEVTPREIQLFIKKLRKQVPKLRYFAVGEYGDTTQRPHYHLALFGYPTCQRMRTRITKDKRPCCPPCDTVQRIWGKGQIQLGTLEKNSIQYIAGYILKKMTKNDDNRLNGRHPEFARMSLKPGIGYDMMHEVASTLMEYKIEQTIEDVPNSLQHGRSQLPLGPYLTRSLRAMIGRPKNAPQNKKNKQKEELSLMRKTAYDNSIPLIHVYKKSTEGKRIQIEARQLRNKKRISL